MSESRQSINPRCIATGNCAEAKGEAQRQHDSSSGSMPTGSLPSFFKTTQWSPDGTCIVTNGEDNRLSTFVLPPELLDAQKSPRKLSPYTTHSLPEPTHATSIYPGFDLANSTTTLLLASPRDHPLRLTNLLDPSARPKPTATYPLVSPTTEAYITANSLAFTPTGTHIVAGARSLLAVFDVSRDGDGPLAWLPTIPSRRKKLVGGGVGMKGLVSALAVGADGLLAAGTYSRWVGLYSDNGRGEQVAVFSVVDPDCDDVVGGRGITQLAWSPCGRYLVVAERRSDGVLVYDVRVTGKRLGCLKGRRALTNQRMGVELVPTEQGNEIWAGGTDGVVRVWSDITSVEGFQEPSFEWHAHEDAVSNTLLHSSGTVAATCSGQRHLDTDDSSDAEDSDDNASPRPSAVDLISPPDTPSRLQQDSSPDTSLKIWAL